MDNIIEIINTSKNTPNFICHDDGVSLLVYPRVHMFTFDLSLISGVLKHGSFGCSLKNMPISISVKKNNFSKDSVRTVGGVDIKKLDFEIDFEKLRKYIGSSDKYSIILKINCNIQPHTGLGLSTQILGGIYLCCARISNVNLTINDLFMLGIGHYSALGLNLLFNPGMIFEMGISPTDEKNGLVITPSISEKHEAPANTVYKINQFPFYTTVAIPKSANSISGNYEIDFWNNSLPDKDEDSYKIIYNVFEKIIPAIVEKKFEVFSAALSENIKLGSKPIEESIQTVRTKKVLQKMREQFDFSAVSSLGPTLYAFSKNDPEEKFRLLDVDDYDFYVYTPNGKVKKKIGKDETILIASFACLGKTTFAKSYPELGLDIESIHYARKYNNKHPDDEIAKGDNDWTPNAEYPINYVRAVVDNLGKYKFIFLTGGKEILYELDKLNIKYSILYPGKNRKKQILVDAKKRGNDENFVMFLEELLSSEDHKNSFKDLNYERYEIIDDGKYIEEYLKENYYYE